MREVQRTRPGFSVRSYNAWLQVDGKCGVPESNEANNARSSKYTVGPDVSVKSFSATVTGSSVAFRGEICYAGTAPGTFDVSLWVNLSKAPTCPTAGADATRGVTMAPNTRASFDTGPILFPRGLYATRMLVDSGCVVTEGTETDNAAVTNYLIP